ncbi:MAG: FAD-dependent monooxygenase, partial [Pseudomonadota bacterium]
HGENWKLWVLCDRDPIVDWVDGRVALLGDAAHPMLQYFAQGACMAMEDAVCLGQMVETHNSLDHALEAYRARRVVRTSRVVMGSRLIGDYIYHPDGAAALVRNAVMSAKTPDQWYDAIEWLYGGNGLSAA